MNYLPSVAYQLQTIRMLKRYNGAMATIQIRNVPEKVHRTYQSRAALAGQSLQEYLLAELIEHAAYASPAEIVAEARRDMLVEGPSGFSDQSVADIIRADRESH